jgi:protease-4
MHRRRILRLFLLSGLLMAGLEAGDAAGTVMIELVGTLPLRPELSLLNLDGELSMHEACETLRRAFRAPEPTVALDLSQGFAPGLAAAEELAAVLRSRPAGKRVICLLDLVDDAALLVAAACDEVVANEAGLLVVDGLALEVDHFAGALAKIGVRFHAVTSGPEKIAPEPLTRSDASPAAQAEYRRLLAAIDAVLLAGSQRGTLDAARLRVARAGSPQAGKAAADLGLADRMVEPGAWMRSLPEPRRKLPAGRELPDPSTLTGIMALWAELLNGPSQQRLPEVVAVVELEGTINDGRGGIPGRSITSADTVEMLAELAEDERIKAVVLRINSPGGSAGASDLICHAVKRLDAVKPVVALFDEVAASGGYYIGCGAREILVHRGTITGSIGVFALAPDLAGTWEKLGITTFRLTSDPRADLFSLGAFTDEKRQALTGVVEAIDARFQAVVAGARRLAPARVAELADGKVYLGEEAVTLGLADGLADLAQAVVRARSLAGVSTPLPVELHPRPQGITRLLGGLGLVHLGVEWGLTGLPPYITSLINDLRSCRPIVAAWVPAVRIR